MKHENLIKISAFSVTIVTALGLCSELKFSEDRNSHGDESESHAPQPEAEKEFWGPDTNGLSAGLSIAYYSRTSFQYFSEFNASVPIRCFPKLAYTGTNYGNVYTDDITFDLPVKRCFQMTLTTENGDIVQKTEKGTAMDKAVPTFYKVSPNPITGAIDDTGWRPARFNLSPGFPSKSIRPIMLQEYFKIKKPGKYKLSFRVCGFIPGLNPKAPRDETLIWLPAVNCEIEIQDFHANVNP